MKILISPTKKMVKNVDSLAPTGFPTLVAKAEILMHWINGLSYEEQKRLWACSDLIARQNALRFSNMDLYSELTPALLAYDGIQFTYMALLYSTTRS